MSKRITLYIPIDMSLHIQMSLHMSLHCFYMRTLICSISTSFWSIVFQIDRLRFSLRSCAIRAMSLSRACSQVVSQLASKDHLSVHPSVRLSVWVDSSLLS